MDILILFHRVRFVKISRCRRVPEVYPKDTSRASCVNLNTLTGINGMCPAHIDFDIKMRVFLYYTSRNGFNQEKFHMPDS